ncbi:MAG TPA: uracil phosphoribosyltransferase [Flavobacterium sp.]|nr:uracil phosphoribosyltransferase [Flavobacterium sp.]
MQIHYLSQHNSILTHFLSQLRNVEVQKDSMRFRRNIERVGEIMSYEISKTLAFEPVTVQTPIAEKATFQLRDKVVLCSILRAGLALHYGFLNYFDDAENGFISAFRHHYNNDDAFEIKVEYQAVPCVDDKILLLVDPMLATGKSLVAVFNKLMSDQNPKEIHIAAVIAAPEGVEYLKQNLPAHCHLWIATLDDRLDEHKYIVPGLGDAGDLAYGNKL